MVRVKMIARREVTLAVILSAAAGYLDAVGYVYLGGFFVSFMSGNTTELATGVAHGDWAPARLAGTLIGMFFAGAVLGALLNRISDGRTVVLAGTTILVGLTALLGDLSRSTWPVALLLPLAMGVVNATFLSSGEASIGLTYMTGALVKAGQRLVDALFGGPRRLWARHLSLWAALLAGGVIGAAMLGWIGLGGALWPITGLLAVITLIVALDRRRRGVFGLGTRQVRPVTTVVAPSDSDTRQ
ncbi:YoaK family protein [Gordonia sp. (in: high G+C Gram-positive bacteria)]|uniref:YoaK family protein n=1 Tax=Gordonia sp. (in: high G+C Gram-positive bacteria) TaxID=84139 RepID=UPI002620BBCE|nr:YoaK family protein [Gordonia sp. (in: high G+C Gram-positive bacteria)]